MFKVGNVVRFRYNGELRWLRITEVKTGYKYLGLIGPVPYLVTGWDYNADYPTGGYRSFKVDKMEDCEAI